MFNLERANSGKPVRLLSLIGILLVPIIVAAGFLGALWKSESRMSHVQAAVVNHDQMVEIDGQPVPLGRQLAAGLTERRDDNFTWVLADDKDAEQGLATGRYAAVITIPEDFSARATSFGGPAEDARQAVIDIETSTTAGVADGTIARIIAETARGTLNTELTKQYLDGIYLGFNEMGEQFQTVADAAGDLSDGTRKLSDGIGETSEGTDELATGTEQYAAGVGEAATGAHELADGMDQLATGGSRLKAGGAELANGGSQLASGASELSSGAGQLADGTGQLASQTKDLPAQTNQLAEGISDAADGADALAGGLGEAEQQMPRLTDGTRQLADGAGELSTGLDQYVGGVNQLVDGLEPATSALNNLSEEDVQTLQAALLMMGEAREGAQEAASQIAEFTRSECPTLTDVEVTPEQQEAFCAQWHAAQQQLEQPVGDTGLTSVEWAQQIADSPELADAADTAEALAPQLPELVEQSGRLGELKTGGDRLASGARDLAAGTDELDNNVGTLADGVTQAADGSRSLADGLGTAADGTRQLADGMVPLANGIQDLDSGAGQLADGASQLSGGVTQYTDGVAQYTDGVGQYTDGVSAAAEGTGEFATGMDQLAAGANGLADGTRQLADGVVELDRGGERLANGSEQLATGLDEGAEKVPSYSKKDREMLSEAAAQPVAGEEAAGFIPLATATALLMVLALWLGALATYLVVQAVARRTLTSTRPTWQLVGHALAPGVTIGVVQAVALTIIGQIVLDLSAAKVIQVFVLLVLGAGVFGSINHALAAWFGGAGRVLSVALVTLTAASGIMSAIPRFFETLAGFSPLTPILTALKVVLTDGAGLTGAVGMSIGWLMVGTAASVAAVMRARQATPDQLRRLVMAAT